MLLLSLSFLLFFSHVPFSYADLITDSNSTVTNTSLTWQTDCTLYGFTDPSLLPGLSCGTYQVPLEYGNISVGSVTLALAKLSAVKEPRLGSLFVNPGGPGDLGTAYIADYGELLRNMSGGHYDIVSWDPRGVGYTSLYIDCFPDSDADVLFAKNDSLIYLHGAEAKGNFTNPSHTDPDELAFRALLPNTTQDLTILASICEATNGDNLKYVGTVSTVRDMVALHDAIEGTGSRINYWGISYGSLLGQVFVNMFPERVGRVIIDGIVNPIMWANQPLYKITSNLIQDVHLVLDEFAGSCAAAGPTYCAIAHSNSTQQSIKDYIQYLMDLTFDYHRAHPNSTYSSAFFRNDLLSNLYFTSSWAPFAEALVSLESTLTSSTSAKRQLPDRATSPTRSFPKRPDLNRSMTRRSSLKKRTPRGTLDIYQLGPAAIACSDSLDSGNVTTADVFDYMVYTSTEVSQTFGPTWRPFDHCPLWPARAVERYTGPWNTTLANPILVIGNVGDPATPLMNAQLVAGMLGSSAVLLTRDGYGHTSIAENSNCTNQVMAAFFNNGTYPPAGTICATDKNYWSVNTTSSDL